MAYKHGVYGVRTASQAKAAAQAEEVVLYVGTAPINLIRGYADLGLVNKPLKLTSLANAYATVGYSEDWDNYTLNEVTDYHFNNTKHCIGPVYFINVLDPDIHRKSTQTEKAVTFTAGKGSFKSTTIILDTFAIEGKVEGTDYELIYDMAAGIVTVDSSKAETPLSGDVNVAFYEINADLVTDADVIGTVNPDGTVTGLKAVKLLYSELNAVCNLIVAPGFSESVDVYKAMCQAAQKINSHWDAFVLADIPLEYGEAQYDEVTATKASNPAAEGWYEHDALNGIYTPSESDHPVADAYYTVSADAGSPTTDPRSEGFYERSGSDPYTYTLTEDTTVDAGKTYYTVTATAVTVVEGSNPSEEGWYVQGDTGYELSSDTYVVSTSTTVYYKKTIVGATVDTIDKAKAWQAANGYTSEISKVFWPKAKNADKVYHLSTIAAAEMLYIDSLNDSIPFVSASNHEIMATGMFFGMDVSNPGYDDQEANALCEVGITTMAFWEGVWKLWGGHTAAYKYGTTMDAAVIFDTNIRMLMYCTNGFQRRHGVDIDQPLSIAKKESIRCEEQQELDVLKSIGALIGNPECLFLEEENSQSDMVNGDFVWHINATVAPQLKSATAKVTYTDEGFSALFGGEG